MENTYLSSPRSSVRRMFLLTLLVSGIAFALYSLAIYPLYVQLSADIAYKDSFLVDLLYLLTEDGVLSLCVFAVCYPATVYAIWRAGLKKAISVPISFAAATLLKYVLNFVMSAIAEQALPSASTFFTVDLPLIAGNYLLEITQYALVVAAAVIIRHLYLKKNPVPTVETADGGETIDALAGLCPFRSLLNLHNPAELSLFSMAAVILLARWMMHLIYEGTLLFALMYGLAYPDSWILVLLYIVTDVIVAALMYLIGFCLFVLFDRKDRKTHA